MTTDSCPVHHDADPPFPSNELNRCPFPFYAAVRDEGGVRVNQPGGEYLVGNWDQVRFVLRHPKIFINDLDGHHAAAKAAVLGPGVEVPPDTIVTTGSLPDIDGPEHTFKRRIARSLVEPARLRAMEPLIAELVNERIDAFVGRGEVEFCAEFANPVAFHLICAILGLSRAAADEYWSHGNPTTRHGARFLSEEARAEQEGRADPGPFLERQIRQRLDHPTDDFLSTFIRTHAERAGEVDVEYLKSETALLLMAGNETTARMMASTMRLLLEHPDQLERVLADDDLVPPVLEESLRLESPTQWVTRRCIEETVVGDVTIPAGALVVLLYASANRDEARWGAEADAFAADRKDTFKHQMAFGGGAHFCLGAPIARLEGAVAFRILFERLRNIRLAAGRNDFENIENLQKRAPRRLVLEFDAA